MAKNKKRTRVKSKKSMRPKLKPATIYSIVQIVFFSLAGLILVSFSRQGLALVRLNDFLVANFSWATIFLPFIFLTFGFLVSKFRTVLGQPNVVVGGLLFFTSITVLTKAGNVGQTAWGGISTLLSPAGSAVALVATSLVGLIVLFNTSLDQLIEVFGGVFRKYGIKGGAKPKFPQKFSTLSNAPLKVIGDSPSSSFGKEKYEQDAKPEAKSDSTIKMDGDGLQSNIVINLPEENSVWKYPPVSILSDTSSGKADRGDIKENAATIEQTLESFGITARVMEVNLGPAVTQYALEVALGTKLSKITALERDMALALAAPTGTIRIEAPIPGRSLVGIELPNRSPEFVSFKKMMVSDEMQKNDNKLAIAMGLDVSGKPVFANLNKMPHVLIAGQTGSGKSVCINTFLSSLLFRASPAEVKLILVDPKRVELSGYNNIPHLLSPVIVEPQKVVSALRWVMKEMDRRYKQFADSGVRNIDAFNEMSGFQALPYIVVFIDELADIMLFSPVEVENAVTRIAQMSRATGIHMVLATQRPSVDVITGLIKANIPARIAFAVSSQIDSRVILDGQGAEKLLGKGDMLYLPPESAKPTRIQGAFVEDKDIATIVSYVKNQGVAPQYTEEVMTTPKAGTTTIDGVEGEMDDRFKEAVELVCQFDRASASLLQRRLSVGYARAARMMDQLEQAGVIGPADASKPREVLVKSAEEFFAKDSVQSG
jgi:DNA segregation ATPase FtsK/SpoIIIE, S-DNA-T family